jgi:hypothetical protein
MQSTDKYGLKNKFTEAQVSLLSPLCDSRRGGFPFILDRKMSQNDMKNADGCSIINPIFPLFDCYSLQNARNIDGDANGKNRSDG